MIIMTVPLWTSELPTYSLRSFIILVAMFLKLIAEPAMRRNRTPLSERRGSRQTSISHCTQASSPSLPPYQHIRLYCCVVGSQRQLCDLSTLRMLSIIASGCIVLVVFMLHVKRRHRGDSSTDGACDVWSKPLLTVFFVLTDVPSFLPLHTKHAYNLLLHISH